MSAFSSSWTFPMFIRAKRAAFHSLLVKALKPATRSSESLMSRPCWVSEASVKRSASAP